ncbi:MAG TPA: IS110 family transposase [Acidobacteriaceae bacterium]
MKILGIDMGWSKSMSCILDSDTGEAVYQAIVTGKEPFAKRIEQAQCDLVVIEAGPMAGWVRDLCEQRNQKLLVLNTSDEPWLWQKVKKKTDRQDALKLCRIAMMQQGSEVHVPRQEVRQQRQLIFYRDTLMGEMTSIKNRLRAVLLQEDIRLASGKKAWSGEDYQKLVAMGRALTECSGEESWRGIVKLELDRLEQLMEQVQTVETKLNALAKKDSRVQRLQQVPGVGARTAELVVAMIDEPERFGRGREVASYGGFTPKKYQSGKMDRDGRISRAGNGLLRKYLVQAAWSGKRACLAMQAIYQRVRKTSPKRSKQAIVAVARHLLIWLWAMLRDGTDWKHQQRQQAATAMT